MTPDQPRRQRVTCATLSLILGVFALAIGIAGCGGDDGPSWQAKQRFMVETVAKVCEGHGGLGYVNFHYHEDLDEATCADGERLRDGEPLE